MGKLLFDSSRMIADTECPSHSVSRAPGDELLLCRNFSKLHQIIIHVSSIKISLSPITYFTVFTYMSGLGDLEQKCSIESMD